MIGLWLVIIVLLLITVGILLLPLIKPHNIKGQLSDEQQNIDIFKDRLTELEQEKILGNLDEDSFLQLKIELKKSLLTDVEGEQAIILDNMSIRPQHWVIISIISILVMSASLGIYFKIGRSDDYALYLTLKGKGELDSKITENATPAFNKIIAILKEKLQKNPHDIEKWFLLANSYSALGKFKKAAQAFASAAKQMDANNPNLAAVKGSWAQMLFQMAGEVITPEVEKIMLEALALDPLESSSLILKGIQTYTTGDLKGAIVYWEKAKTKADEHLLSNFIEPVIKRTKIQLGEAVESNTSHTHINNARIELKLDISDDLKLKTKADDVIFVFAQKAGSKMPLAVARLQIKDLPKTIILDDTKSPMPAAKLSSAEFVDITARVSFTGHPKAAKGDLFVVTEKVEVTDRTKLNMVINKIVE